MEEINNTARVDTEVTDALKFETIKEKITSPVKKLLRLGNEHVLWDESDEYDFNNANRGTAIIFNMEQVKTDSGELESRIGSSIDAERVRETFKSLGFSISYYENHTKEQVMDILTKEAKRDHSDEDCFACIILTHGSSYYRVNSKEQYHTREDMIMAADTTMLTSDILKLFRDSNCKTLQGKPKLFFIQACRGDTFDKGAFLETRDEVDAKPENSTEHIPCPIYKDFLVMYATPPGYYAFRHPINGSWYIQALCRALSSAGVRNKTLLQLLTSVINIVSTEHQAQAPQYLGNKQTPCFMSMLVKDVYFRLKEQKMSLPI